jgi:hypothetical protein
MNTTQPVTPATLESLAAVLARTGLTFRLRDNPSKEVPVSVCFGYDRHTQHVYVQPRTDDATFSLLTRYASTHARDMKLGPEGMTFSLDTEDPLLVRTVTVFHPTYTVPSAVRRATRGYAKLTALPYGRFEC